MKKVQLEISTGVALNMADISELDFERVHGTVLNYRKTGTTLPLPLSECCH
jgi:hypothetical protein